MDCTLCVTSPDDEEKVKGFIFDHFVPHMPLLEIIGLHNPPRQDPPRRKPKNPKDFTIKAIDAQGQIIGVAINKVDAGLKIDLDASPEEKNLVELLNFVEEHAQLNQLPESKIELRVLSVHQDWRQRGVARMLAEESMRLARDAGFTTMTVCCTSEFTAKLARSLGWREQYRLAYKDYPQLSGKDICLKPLPPHDYVYYYVTDL